MCVAYTLFLLFLYCMIHITCVGNQCALSTILKHSFRVFKLSAYDPRACDPQLQCDPKRAIHVACSRTLHVLLAMLLFALLHNLITILITILITSLVLDIIHYILRNAIIKLYQVSTTSLMLFRNTLCRLIDIIIMIVTNITTLKHM